MTRISRMFRALPAYALLSLMGFGNAEAMSSGIAEATEIHPRIVNGLYTHAFPTTGALLVGGNPDGAGSWCSGTLIGCKTFLTAAHCIEGNSDPGAYFVFLQHAGFFSVASLASHPDYSFPEADVAVVTLGSNVTGISPTPINTTNPASFLGQGGQIVGFGRSGADNDDYGLKRWGEVTTTNCQGTPGGTSDTELICWNFVDPVGAPGEDSNTCNGDSGGPLFMEIAGNTVVAGITSGGDSPSCLAADHSYDANVFTYRSFIQDNLGVDSTTACGAVPPVGEAGVTVTGYSDTLGGGSNSEKRHTISVGTGLQELRITMNSGDDGSLNADLYVKHDSEPTTNNSDCAQSGSSPHGSCLFSSPSGGDWHILVKRTSGNGDYQVTVTEFAGDPSVCGNDLDEWDEECDGADASSCEGLCQPDCTCPAPLCGNDVLEAGEECDGSASPACPGECGTSGPEACMCPTDCGNGSCDADETVSNCSEDCGCNVSVCGDQAAAGCYCDAQCASIGDCCPNICDACGLGCSPAAGGLCAETGVPEKVRMTISRLDKGAGEQTIVFTGWIDFSAAPLTDFDPLNDGAQVVIEDLGASEARILDLSTDTQPVPAGGPGSGCDSRDGWYTNKAGNVVTYRNFSSAYDPSNCTSQSPGRLTLKLIDKQDRKGKVKFVVRAKKAAVGSVVGPFRGTIALDGSAAAMNGACADYAFEGADCVQNAKGNSWRCR